jgi:hypothetical protein
VERKLLAVRAISGETVMIASCSGGAIEFPTHYQVWNIILERDID